MAQTYARAFERLEDARIVAVSDIEIEAATALARDIGRAGYDCIERMVAECDLEAAIVCTPPSTHPEICIRLAECNIGVLCEKPFSIAVNRAEEMLSAARKSGVIIAMASKFRYVEDVLIAPWLNYPTGWQPPRMKNTSGRRICSAAKRSYPLARLFL